MAKIEYFLSKKVVHSIITDEKTYCGSGISYTKDIKLKLKVKKNRPPYVSMEILLDNDYSVKLQTNPESEFETFTAILVSLRHGNFPICRLDYHEAHRRRCKKEMFENKYYDDLHFHVYCDECLKQKLKADSMVFNVNENKLSTFKFECFIKAFFDIIHLETNDFDCGKTLELEWT